MPVTTHVPHAQTAGAWIKVGTCQRCGGEVFETRAGTNWGRQEEHSGWCRAQARDERSTKGAR